MGIARAWLVAAIALASGATAADKPCTGADAAEAEKAIERVVNWSGLHKAWQDYRHCDTGPVADVYTDALLRLVVEWKNVDVFASTVQKDAQFKAFVHAHLRSPAAKDDREAVHSRVTLSCPKGMDAFCADLAGTVKASK